MQPVIRLALPLTLLLAACIGIIRALPYDASELRTFLTPPDGCPMPCFMGIRPGVTTVEEAIANLRAHEWIGTVQDITSVNDRSFPPNVYGEIFWDWSGLQPSLIDENIRGRLWIGRGQVTGVSLATRIRLGEMWQLLGQPDIGIIARIDTDETYRALIANYTSIPLGVGADWHCPVNATAFWHAPLSFVLPSFTGRLREFTLMYPRC